MSLYVVDPLSIDEWRAFKRTLRHIQHQQRLAEADEGGVADRLAAVERDDRADPYERRQERREGAHA